MLSVYHHRIFINTTGDTDIIDITREVVNEVEKTRIIDGTVTLFVSGSTGALTTIEFENGVINDLKMAIERMAPKDLYYEHNERWGDGNGYSHVRAAIFGASLSVPIVSARLTLGTWQQIVLLDFDNRPRKRRIEVQILG